ncbi:hypothetical protein [Neobacillus cucumis]|uniref:Uncharacterized protein n=1 Tax=Neobacillus cucumis TaxID=1740721 RepID=A0A2N5HSU7_9BACI|nr:hypothetical protein [Neobacillus cucumis]PLS08592.1 hypothetical protein CVD27_04120 [Neobacillus cucumis]
MDYNSALRLEGKMIKFKNKQGNWSIGRVLRVKKNGLEIEELQSLESSTGYGFGFWGPRPFWGPPCFFPFIGIEIIPFFFW